MLHSRVGGSIPQGRTAGLDNRSDGCLPARSKESHPPREQVRQRACVWGDGFSGFRAASNDRQFSGAVRRQAIADRYASDRVGETDSGGTPRGARRAAKGDETGEAGMTPGSLLPGGFLPIANHLWQSTVFAGIAGLLTLLLRNNRAHARYCLWLAASAKSMCGPVGNHRPRQVPRRVAPKDRPTGFSAPIASDLRDMRRD